MKLAASQFVLGLVMTAQALVIGGAVAAYYNYWNDYYVGYFTTYIMFALAGGCYWLIASETCHRLGRLTLSERHNWVRLGYVILLLLYLVVAIVLWWLVCGFIIVNKATSSKKVELRAAA